MGSGWRVETGRRKRVTGHARGKEAGGRNSGGRKKRGGEGMGRRGRISSEGERGREEQSEGETAWKGEEYDK